MTKELSSRIVDTVTHLERSQIWIAEAQNALQYISPHLELPKGARVLEIGSGACVLLGHMTLEYEALNFTGIEPLGPGFDSLNKYIKSIKAIADVNLLETSYEEAKIDKPYDLVFLINVFEHLPDWRHFLKFAREAIGQNGKCIILCPNYGFPIESHYGLPILFNKSVSYRVFKQRIAKFDEANDCHGLWDSLNFVKFRDVKNAARELNLDVQFDPRISFKFIERLKDDEEFRRRHGKLGTIARMIAKTGLLNVFKHRLFWNYHPYMQLEITRSNSNSK